MPARRKPRRSKHSQSIIRSQFKRMKTAKQRPREFLSAPKVLKSLLLLLVTLLTWIGKPFYPLLVGAFILFAILVKSVLHFFSLLGKQVILIVMAAKARWIKTRFPSTKKGVVYPKRVKFPFPKLKLPKFSLILPFWSLQSKTSLKRVLPAALVIILLFTPIVLIWFALLRTLPLPGELVTRDRQVTTKIYDRNEKLLFKIFRSQNRTLIQLSEIPLHVRQATIAVEDQDFYSHPGFSIRGITRAIFRNLTRGQLAGGSTITQQLVKNAFLSPEKTINRKARELILAVQVELSFSKDQILEMYLNEVGYGGAAYGIEEAAQLYFGKPAQKLTLAEGALLAGLPRAPTTYSPFGANPQLAKARQLEVLSQMVKEGYISQEEAQKAASSELVFAPQKTDIAAPHFVMYVKQLLVEKYGERMVEEGGLEVVTSLDLSIQGMAEKVVAEETEKIKRLRISNGSALVTNPATGEILAMVGSRNYFDQKNDGNFNVTTALRQPGSAIKPIMYSYALESKKFTAASILSDTPVTYKVPGGKPYSPRNYDNVFRGKVPLRIALGSSLNVPAVKVLASYGVDKMIGQGKKLGITTWNEPSRFGLSLTLGGGEVKMTDMAVAYGTLANYGKRVDLNPILKVTDYTGKILEENTCKKRPLLGRILRKARAAEAATAEGCGRQVLSPGVAFILSNILSDNISRFTAFGSRSLLAIPNHPEVAVKTGTTQNLRDNWAVGYAKEYFVAAWVGNNDNSPMSYVASGITGATPIWHKIMLNLLEGENTAHNHKVPEEKGEVVASVKAQNQEPYWEIPQEVKKVTICPITGTLPCEGCPKRNEYFLEGTEPKNYCVVKKVEEQQKEPQPQGGQNLQFQILEGSQTTLEIQSQ